MTSRRALPHIAVWSGVFVLWLLATRRFHPTMTIAAAATAVLVSASALAVYLNGLLLLPRFMQRRRAWPQYVLALLATLIVLDLMAVVAIQVIYALLWHPDPLRFGFWFNLMSDGFIIALHLVAAMGIAWMAKPWRSKLSEGS